VKFPLFSKPFPRQPHTIQSNDEFAKKFGFQRADWQFVLTLKFPIVNQRRMNRAAKCVVLVVLLSRFCAAESSRAAEIFRVATYNVENYLDAPAGTRHVKSAEAKAKILETILSAKPDVIALQEMGDTNTLLELRASLKSSGLDFLNWEHITGYDTNIHLAILSKFPFTARRPHTNLNFLLDGRRFQVCRGFAEVDVKVATNYSFTMITAHLKSRRPAPEADEAEWREQEAIQLREIIETRLKSNPNLNLIVLGDLNDVKDSRSTRTVISRGKTGLFDTRPAEKNGDNLPGSNPRFDPPNITWTHFYGKEDTYSRIDYILLSSGMKREWLPDETRIAMTPNWGAGSDHRLIVAGFSAEEK
jgi:endonuclease/exonuclease/phosphatase family metal-dependent hydrolase